MLKYQQPSLISNFSPFPKPLNSPIAAAVSSLRLSRKNRFFLSRFQLCLGRPAAESGQKGASTWISHRSATDGDWQQTMLCILVQLDLYDMRGQPTQSQKTTGFQPTPAESAPRGVIEVLDVDTVAREARTNKLPRGEYGLNNPARRLAGETFNNCQLEDSCKDLVGLLASRAVFLRWDLDTVALV